MSKVIRLSRSLVTHAAEAGSAAGISASQQIEHWVRLGKFAEDRPDLTGQTLLDMLNAQSPLRK